MFNSLELIIGPVCSGKSMELLRRIDRYKIAGYNIVVAKPVIDVRSKEVKSRIGTKTECVSLNKSSDIYGILVENTLKQESNIDIIAFDEGQFFDDIFATANKLIRQGYKVLVSALDTDFNGTPFDEVLKLVTISDDIQKLTAICMVCRCPHAIFNQKLKKGGDRIEIGDLELYQPRCVNCFSPGGI